MSSQQYQFPSEWDKKTAEDDDYLDSFPPGYRFCPTDSELVMDYLQRKVLNMPLPRNKIADVNLYAHSPDTLAAQYKKWGDKEWYFFTPRDKKYPKGNRPRRDAGNGFWKATGADKPVLYENRRVGSRKALVFYVGHPPNGRKTNWIMHEFRMVGAPQSISSTNDMRLDDWVLCRIYLKAEQPNRALPASPANSSPPAASPVHPAPLVNYPSVARPAPPFNYPHAPPMGQVNYPPSSLPRAPPMGQVNYPPSSLPHASPMGQVNYPPTMGQVNYPPSSLPHAPTMGQVNYPPSSVIARLAPSVAHPVPPFNYPPMAFPDPLAPPGPFIARSVPPASSIGSFGNYTSTENGTFWNSGTENGSFRNDGAEYESVLNDGADYARFFNEEPLLNEVAFWNRVVGDNRAQNGAFWNEVTHLVLDPGAFQESTPPPDPGTESTLPPGAGIECPPPLDPGAFPPDDTTIRFSESVKRQKLLKQPQQLKTSKQPDNLRKSQEDAGVDDHHDEKGQKKHSPKPIQRVEWRASSSEAHLA